MKKALQVILHLLGFPLLIALVVIFNIPIIKGGISYGIMVFVGIIVTVVMALIYYIAYICVVKSKKKSIFKQTLTLILVIFFTLCGLWIVVDFALPDFFSTATSGTVFYEDLTDNYQARADVQEALLNDFIERAYYAGTLPDETEDNGYSLDEYLSQGNKNENVQQLLAIEFASIDTNGYASFVPPWISMANDSRLTIPTLVHLLIDDRDPMKEQIDLELYDEKTRDKIAAQNWDVLDMLGTANEIPLDLNGVVVMDIDLGKVLPGVLPLLKGDLRKLTEKLVGSPIKVEYENNVLYLIPANEDRGVLDYMSMAWLNSNGLLYAIVSLLSVRTFFLIFAGWLILSNFLIGLLRGMGKENVKLTKIKGVPQQGRQQQNGYQQDPHRYGFIQVGPNSYSRIDMAEIRRNLMQSSREQRNGGGAY